MSLSLVVAGAVACLVLLFWPLPILVRRRRRLAGIPARRVARAWGLAAIPPLAAWAIVASSVRIHFEASGPAELVVFGLAVATLVTILLTAPLAVVSGTVLWYFARRRAARTDSVVAGGARQSAGDATAEQHEDR